MKRRSYKALVTDHTGLTEIEVRDTFAWNSAIKATESIVRDYARSKETTFTGDKPRVIEGQQIERMYSRHWESPSGERVQALVWEVA